MKVMTILGTRPEIIRLSLLIRKLDDVAERHFLVHTGQNFTPGLSGRFFAELGLRQPDLLLNARRTTVGGQLAAMFEAVEQQLAAVRPDRVLVLGDTNSALCAILAERMGYPVVHMEAGNRCFDLEVPEEKNRKIIDAVSTYNLPYTENSRQNLLREGYPAYRIFRSGNPIYEVIRHYEAQISASSIHDQLGLVAGDYLLATIHRSENVDRPEVLESILQGFERTVRETGLRLVCSLHPRTRSRLPADRLAALDPRITWHEPFGFFDFTALERGARCVLTDSGTVQEECCLFGVPTVTVRRTTERPETVDCGSNVVSGRSPERIADAVRAMLAGRGGWTVPEGYQDDRVSDKVAKFLFGGRADV